MFDHTAYMPDGATYNGIANILPSNYRDTLAVGDVLDDGFVNPLLWHRDPEKLAAGLAQIPGPLSKHDLLVPLRTPLPRL